MSPENTLREQVRFQCLPSMYSALLLCAVQSMTRLQQLERTGAKTVRSCLSTVVGWMRNRTTFLLIIKSILYLQYILALTACLESVFCADSQLAMTIGMADISPHFAMMVVIVLKNTLRQQQARNAGSVLGSIADIGECLLIVVCGSY